MAVFGVVGVGEVEGCADLEAAEFAVVEAGVGVFGVDAGGGVGFELEEGGADGLRVATAGGDVDDGVAGGAPGAADADLLPFFEGLGGGEEGEGEQKEGEPGGAGHWPHGNAVGFASYTLP